MKFYEYVLRVKDQFSAGMKSFISAAGGSGDAAVQNARKIAGMNKEASKIPGVFGMAKKAIATAFVGFSLLGIGREIVSVGADAEQTKIAFDVLLQSAEKSKVLRTQLQKFADTSPFSTSQTYAAGESLLAFGVKAEGLLPIMGRLGDLAKGNGVKFQSLVDNYGKAVSAQRANTVDLNQFAIAGVPIWDAVGKVIGKTGVELRKYVEQNGVSISQLNQAFESLTDKGGMFFGMMELQSKSTLGLWSTFVSGVENRAVQLFNVLQPLINSTLVFGTEVLNNSNLLSGLATALTVAGTAYLIYKTAMGLATIGSMAATAWTYIQIASLYTAAGAAGNLGVFMTLLTAAQYGLNAAIAANPFVFWLTVIGAVIGAIAVAYNKFEGFRVLVKTVGETLYNIGKLILGLFLRDFGMIKSATADLKKNFSGETYAEITRNEHIKTELAKVDPAAAQQNLAYTSLTAAIGQKQEKPFSMFWKQQDENKTEDKPAGMADITGGGSKPLTVNISFRNFIEELKIMSNDIKQGVDQTEDQLGNMFNRLIDGAVSSTGR